MYQRPIIEKFNQYFHQKMSMWDYRKGWLKGNCPICGKEDKYGIHLGENRTNCFVCGYNDKPLEVILKKERFSKYTEVWGYLKTFEGLEYLEPKYTPRLEIPTITLPESFHSLSDTSNQFGKSAYNYIKYKRKLDPDLLSKRGYGYCTEGRWCGYLIIPFYQNNRLIYYIGRTFLDIGTKFQNPQEDEVGIGKSHIFFNIDSLALYDDIFLVESVLNAETLGEEALVSLGKFVSSYQLSLIIKSSINSITLLLDPDAYYQSIKLALQLVPYKKVKVVNLPEDKDVNDLGYEETMKYVNQEKFLNYNEILRLKHSYERTKRAY